MNKLSEFKEFVKDNKHLIDLVDSGKQTWQSLYEHYDLFGPDDKLFKKPDNESSEDEKNNDSNEKEEDTEKKSTRTNGEKKEGLGSIVDAISGFDVDKLNEGLNGMKKILSILSEVTKPEEAPVISKRKLSKPYQRNDD